MVSATTDAAVKQLVSLACADEDVDRLCSRAHAEKVVVVHLCIGYVLRGGRYRTPEEDLIAQEQGDTPVDYFGKALLASGGGRAAPHPLELELQSSG